MGFEEITEADNKNLDGECDRFNEVIQFIRDNPLLATLMYGPITLRTMLWLHNLSDDFFLYRLYPVIRFVIVSGSKGTRCDVLDSLQFHQQTMCHRILTI